MRMEKSGEQGSLEGNACNSHCLAGLLCSVSSSSLAHPLYSHKPKFLFPFHLGCLPCRYKLKMTAIFNLKLIVSRDMAQWIIICHHYCVTLMLAALSALDEKYINKIIMIILLITMLAILKNPIYNNCFTWKILFRQNTFLQFLPIKKY